MTPFFIVFLPFSLKNRQQNPNPNYTNSYFTPGTLMPQEQFAIIRGQQECGCQISIIRIIRRQRKNAEAPKETFAQFVVKFKTRGYLSHSSNAKSLI